ncbi:MAG: hypothetical protein WC943_15775 [Elusimicrobiota bacterium]
MSFLGLRWLLLIGTLVLLGRFLAFRRDSGGLAAFLACGLAWACLSRLKARSIDGPEGGGPWRS